MTNLQYRLGDFLLSEGYLTQEQLDLVLSERKNSKLKLGDLLLKHKMVSESQIAEAISKQMNIAFIHLRDVELDLHLAQRLPEQNARAYEAILLKGDGKSIRIAMVDPTDLFAFDEICRLIGERDDFELVIITPSDLNHAINEIYLHTSDILDLAGAVAKNIKQLDDGAVTGSADSINDQFMGEQSPVVKLLQSMFEDAVRAKASDIHIESQHDGLHVRFRIDGELLLHTQMDARVADALAVRLKLISGLSISEKRVPQDGRFNIRVQDDVIDVRLSTMPTQYGESIVMRLLNQSNRFLTLAHLGMSAEMEHDLREVIHGGSGMILVTGPTGSGKTTTLYAVLAEANSEERKIITVEDPVEYRLPGINQVQVNDKIDLSFSRVLRAVLRQDPDMILVGEMRDVETAQIGLQAAMTGHMVFSTLHTNDAASTLFRLIDMGVKPYVAACSVRVVIAQRLLRCICKQCSVPYAPTEQDKVWLYGVGVEEDAWGNLRIGRGCSVCNHTGFRGRKGIYEMLMMTPLLASAASEADSSRFMQLSRSSLRGRSLKDAALKAMGVGETSLKEAMRFYHQESL
ncbi:MAG: Flp pilus assembly complex ATPase component TadA [Zetaproteobacteria bacterium]|nr:Flp pilus assembly complex ATPase component TadA [Zetaproteobacteria bacterium]